MKARTTLTVEVSDLDMLCAQAVRRGTPLSEVLAEAVTEKTAALRRRRRPRVGMVRSTDGESASEIAAEPIAHA